MFELKYDILDDLEARESNAARQVADEEEHLLTPKEWYEECRRTGVNAVFAIYAPYRLFHLSGGYNFDIDRFVEAYNDIKERFFRGLPDVQVVHHEKNYLNVVLPDWIQTETDSDSFDFLCNRVDPKINEDDTIIFKIPCKIDIVQAIKTSSLENSDIITIQHLKTDECLKRIGRVVTKVCDFLASIQAFNIKYKLKRVIILYSAHDENYEGGTVDLSDIPVYMFDIKYRNRRFSSQEYEFAVIESLTNICNLRHDRTSMTDFRNVKYFFNEWANKQLKYVNK
jgi:hypothetical protein